DRGAALPDVLPRALGPHVLRGLPVWAARVLGRRGERRPAGVRRDDGGGPRGPPPEDVARARDGQPGDVAVSIELVLTSDGALPPMAFAAFIPKIFVSVVTETGHDPCSAGRPFLSVTSEPVNSLFSRHFMQ